MKRSIYFNSIEEKLDILATRINARGRLNVLDYHNHSETFFQYFLNELYGWSATNENENKSNVEAIDLIDHKNNFVIQISATNTKQKIENSLSKNIIKEFKNYTFKFVSISKDANKLQKCTFANPHGINFEPSIDIIDINSILKHIKGLKIDDLKRIYTFIKKELSSEIDFIKLESNLARIIDILAKEDWDKKNPVTEIDAYEIDRKITFNNLKSAINIIDDYKLHYGRLDKIYKEFDSLGLNKSKSVMSTISKVYSHEKENFTDDSLFFVVLEKILERIIKSSNFIPIPYEELELCVNILVVDAFIRCKIFENPEGYNHVASR
ncbi:MAG: SMEK domain-containing protein [Candidatus Delongbacteria bacterium]|jgi:hypothetical protein|nr:SMEK domain-containing protein [Candidatus Delongbacteria bacterium]